MGCKKTITLNPVYDQVIYNVGRVPIYTAASQKNKQKTNTQFISILYADLFQQSISGKKLNDMAILATAVGDKGMLNELLVSNFMNDPAVILPTSAAMNADVDKFIDDTYVRFYLRKPTTYEKAFLKNMISTDASLTPELIYTSFALSDEYQYYQTGWLIYLFNP